MIIFILYTLIAILLAGVFIATGKKPDAKCKVRLPKPIRILLSILLAFSAFLIWQSSQYAYVYCTWVLIGMLLSLIGDLAMAEVIAFHNRMVGGMVFFFLAHCSYITAYIRTLNQSSLPLISWNFIIIFAFLEITVYLVWRYFIMNHEGKQGLNIGSLLYGFCIAFMASTAVSLAVTVGRPWYAAAAGAILFMISDLIIAVTKIGTASFNYSEIYIWVTYVSGQIGIIYSPWLK